MRSFVKEYFDGKPVPRLKRAITPDWSEANLARHLDLLAVPPEAKKLLEIGCGMGRLLIPLYDRGGQHCVGVDASRDMVAAGNQLIGGRHIWILPCDGQGKIPLEMDNYFDFAFSIITFQHIPNLATVITYLAEAHRLLRPGGVLRFQVLGEDVKPGRELWTYHDLRILQNYLISQGYQGVKVRHAGVWAIFTAQKTSSGEGKI
jgi:SAM-dependent methyltransferase